MSEAEGRLGRDTEEGGDTARCSCPRVPGEAEQGDSDHTCPAHLFNNCPINGFIRVQRIHLIYFRPTIKSLSVFTTTASEVVGASSWKTSQYLFWLNFVWCVVPSTIMPCWFLFADRIGLLSCMTRRKCDIEWRSDHMSTGVSWWDENNSANFYPIRDLQSYPWLWAQWDVTYCHASQSPQQPSQNGHFCQPHQWSGPLVPPSVSSFCNLFWCPCVCCDAVLWGEVYKCFFLCRGRLSRPSSLSLSSRTIISPAPGLTNAKVSVGCPLSRQF